MTAGAFLCVLRARFFRFEVRLLGTAMVVKFELDGQEFLALNGGPQFTFTEAISLLVSCKDQKEIDHYWEALSAGARGYIRKPFTPDQVKEHVIPVLGR